MTEPSRDRGRPERDGRWWLVLLAFLAYVPALTAAPGRMPADSKLYLYLDPGGFLADAASSFDPGQFAGWVPHQHVSYLWPAGPWFWLFDAVGVPDWVAHRLWIGSLFLAAGAGVRWSARLLGIGRRAALTAAVVYQVSVYILPYVSRTSVMLLPWAGLGWIVGCTIRATLRRSWADPAAIALLVFTVGAVNATALAMIVPAPVLWLVHAAWQRTVSWRRAAVVAAQVAVLSIVVSLWWIVALAIQGRYGAEVLPYSESLADVSLTSTAPEVWRGLGYWLFYVRDPYAATTTESLRYLSSTTAIAMSYLLPVLCLLGLVWVRWAHRRFAALLVVVGGVLAVGVHPIADRNPLMRLLAGGDDGLALALRSSTRALPVMLLGFALAAAALVESVPTRALVGRLDTRTVTASGLMAVALLNLPGLWGGAVVDPALERAEDPPAAWQEAADALDELTSGRVLMLPGQEFGAYRWGYTVDQPLPGLADTPVVTRDLLPLGSPAAMDLLYAFDDRFQDGIAEPAALDDLARLFAADVVWLTNDIGFDRFRVARPEIVRDQVLSSPSLDEVTAFGEPTVNTPDVAMVDGRSLADPRVGQAAAPVELAELAVDAPLARAYVASLLVAGSGDGVVDAAAAGLVSPDVAIRYVAGDPALDDTVVGQLVTDSNRDRARHWRSSQDTTGYTEPGGPGNGLLADAVGDARLPVFDADGPGVQTVAVQIGPVTATASGYGEPFAYLPEHRPFMAIDGDPTTAWLVGEHGDPVGQTLQLRVAGTPEHRPSALRLVQAPTSGRRILEVVVTEFDGSGATLARRTVPLGAVSVLEVGLAADPSRVDWIDVTITAVGGGEPGTAGVLAGVGFAEIDLGIGPTEEIVRPPAPVLNAPDDLPLAYLFTRRRVDPLDRWRSDPEPRLVRGWALDRELAARPTFTVRLDARADDATLAGIFGWPVMADARLTGSLRNVGAAAFDGDASTAWITPFDHPGASLHVAGVAEPISSIEVVQPSAELSRATQLTLEVGDEVRVVTLGGGPTPVDPPLPAGNLTLTLTGVETATTVDRRYGDTVVLPVAVSEIVFEGAPRVSVIGSDEVVLECVELARLDDVPLRATVTIAGDDWIDGAPLVATACDEELALRPGEHRLDGTAGPFRLDRVLLDDGLTAALATPGPPPGVEERSRNRFGATYDIEGCDQGCWFVFGEGFDDGWAARTPAGDLGPPVLLDGGFDGWWLPAGTEEFVVSWRPQRWMTFALVVSLLGALGCLGILVRFRRSPAPAPAAWPAPVWAWDRRPSGLPSWAIVAVWAGSAMLLAGPVWAVLAGLGGVVAARYRSVPVAALTTLATVGVIGLVVAAVERRDSPFPGGGWPATFAPLHWVGMVAFATLLAAALTEPE